MCPFSLQLLYPNADVQRVVASNMAMGVLLVDLMPTAVGDELEVAHLERRLQQSLASTIQLGAHIRSKAVPAGFNE